MGNEIMIFASLVFGAAAIALYVLFFYLTQDFLNPFGCTLFGFSGAFAIGCLRLNPAQPVYSINVFLAVGVCIISILFVGLLSCRGLDTDNGLPFAHSSARFFRIYLVLCLLCGVGIIFVIVNALRLLPELVGVSAFDRKIISQLVTDIPAIPRYLISLIPFLPIFAAFDLLYCNCASRGRVRFNSISIVASVLFSWFILTSRGSLLASALGCFYLAANKYKFKFKHYVFAVASALLLFGVLGLIRVNPASMIFDGATGSPLINSIYNYIGPNFSNLDALISDGSPMTLGMKTFPSLFKLVGLYDSNAIIVKDLDGVLNASTFLYNYFHDWGWLGVVIVPLLVFIFVGCCYRKSKSNCPELILILATIQKAVFMTFYGEYFFGSLAEMIPLAIACMFVVVLRADAPKRAI